MGAGVKLSCLGVRPPVYEGWLGRYLLSLMGSEVL